MAVPAFFLCQASQCLLGQEDVKHARHVPDRNCNIIGPWFRLPEHTVITDGSEQALQAPPVIFEQVDQYFVSVHYAALLH
jgi:hypothetical protein